MKWLTTSSSYAVPKFGRRFLGSAIGACAVPPIIRLPSQLGAPATGSLTKEQRDCMTNAEVIEELERGTSGFERIR
jgi:hypothetical protein